VSTNTERGSVGFRVCVCVCLPLSFLHACVRLSFPSFRIKKKNHHTNTHPLESPLNNVDSKRRNLSASPLSAVKATNTSQRRWQHHLPVRPQYPLLSLLCAIEVPVSMFLYCGVDYRGYCEPCQRLCHLRASWPGACVAKGARRDRTMQRSVHNGRPWKGGIVRPSSAMPAPRAHGAQKQQLVKVGSLT